MAGTEIIVPDDGVRLGDPPYPLRRQRARSYIMAGIALSGWVGFVLLGVVLLLRPTTPVAAKPATTPDAVWLLVGPLIVADPWVQTPLPIQISPSPPRESWIKITGMPALASLSAGHTIGAGAWKVPVAALSTLTIMAPSRDTVRSEIQISLMSAAGVALVDAKSVLAVIPPAMCGAIPKAGTGSLPDDLIPGAIYRPSSRLPLPILTSEEDRRRAQELLLLGEIQRLQGRFSSARGYYEQAATMGWPLGAMALAATFDPHEIGGSTLRPDIDTARAWYKRSQELADATVAFYLKRLEQ
jgi:hypothetical protein